MRTLYRSILLSALLSILPAHSLADAVYLRSGAMLVGDVALRGENEIVVRSYYPEEGLHVVDYTEVTPQSLYEILDRRSDPSDPEARLRLAQLAEEHGLHGPAIANYLAVARLQPKRRAEMDAHVQRVQEAIAGQLLEDAKALLDTGNPRGALLYLHTLQERYAGTQAAKEAKKLMKTAHQHAGPSTDVAKKTVSSEKAPKVIASADKDLKKGDREVRAIPGHEGVSSRDQRAAERAIRYYEAAWKKVKTLPVAAPDGQLRKRIEDLRGSTKHKLANAYLTAGSIHLQRQSITRAEDYCNKACELLPDEKANHMLHRLIIEAKIYSGSGWITGR